MKKIAFLFGFILSLLPVILLSQTPENFNYQAVIRNSSGELVTDQDVGIKVSILDETSTGTILYSEEHAVSTNAYGQVAIEIGGGTLDSGDFSSIDWGINDKFLKLEVDIDGGTNYVPIGTSQMLSVPYALYANVATTAELLGTEGVYSTSSDTLFVVKDHSGNVVFVIFPDGAQVIVNQEAKGKVGGFAVSGRSPSKADDIDILKVTIDSTRIYVNDTVTAKGKVGGFAVSGRSPSKNTGNDLLFVTGDSTRITFNKSAKGKVGGFAVSGRSPGKGTLSSLLNLFEDNYFIGHESGINTTGTNNLFLGYESGLWNNSGASNVFIGPKSGHQNSIGFGNIFIGNYAGYHNSDIDSGTYVGTEGYFNVYIGYNSGADITKGKYNTFVGYATCASGITGEFNTYIGNQAGNQSKGNENVFLGVKAGELAREGSSNVFLGNFAGQRCYNGSKNVFIGYFAGYGADVSDKLYIDNSSTSSPLIYGDFTDGSELVQINGDLHITGTLTGGKSLKSADFVFEKNYKLESIEEHAEFMWENKHLPALKGQRAIEAADGYDMIERREAVLEELEKAHIYIEQLNTEIKFIKEENQELKQKLNEIIILLESK